VQAWFADDSCGAGRSEQLVSIIENLVKWGPSFGYFPSPEKSWLLCSEEAEPFARHSFEEKGLEIQYTRGTRYLGAHIGAETEKAAWLLPNVEQWTEAVATLEKISARYPQTAFYGLAVSLQNEWMHVCRTVPGAGAYLGPVETALCSYLSNMLDVPLDADGELRKLLGQKVKQGGMGIQNSTTSAEGWLEISLEASEALISALKSGVDVNVEQHETSVRATCNQARAAREAGEATLREAE
jgi:hypothetical protein